jgi:hypothetical protein
MRTRVPALLGFETVRANFIGVGTKGRRAGRLPLFAHSTANPALLAPPT